jgi:hypothetical protein
MRRYSEPQILAILRQAEGGVPRARNKQRGVLQMAVEVSWDGRLDDQPNERLGRQEPASQEDVCRVENASRVTEGSPWKKVIRPVLRRGLAENAVARHGVNIELACRTL